MDLRAADGAYSSGHTDLVFNRYGTKVYATDGNSSGTFDPGSETQDTWYYTPPRYWHRGTYTFAAALPASIFNASHAKTPEENIGNLATTSCGIESCNANAENLCRFPTSDKSFQQ